MHDAGTGSGAPSEMTTKTRPVAGAGPGDRRSPSPLPNVNQSQQSAPCEVDWGETVRRADEDSDHLVSLVTSQEPQRKITNISNVAVVPGVSNMFPSQPQFI